MQDTAIKNFCIWARRELMAQVALQARRFGIREDGYDPATADAIEGRPLTADERRQRADLIRRLGPVDAPGYKEAYGNLVDQAAYTWFNRLIAIRFMELNDRLPSHVRMLSAADGAFRPQVLREALDVPIEGLDAAQVSELLRASDDEALFRCLFLAQCRELAACLPDVFEPVGAAMELLLPEGLLRQGSVVQRLVDDVPEEDWREGVEIVGWMYQYYVSERKDEVFASFTKGTKAAAGAIAPATPLFTPDWIVRYLTENSLGRLWLQSHSESHLADQMPYYIPDNLGAEDADADSGTRPVGGDLGRPSEPAISPESLRVIDPACGSGHILVYAFRLLAAMYEETGHIRRDIPRLILQNNLTGCEIDPRAAQMASFALAMTACEWDSRFLRRADKVSANIVCLRPAEIDADELEEMPYLAERTALLDAMAHMGECGSLFAPEPEDIAALERADDELDAREAGGDLLAHRPHAAVAQMLANCKPLIETYDAVIANPPYMGGKNMGKWLSDWAKKSYPDVKSDLFSCFIERNLRLSEDGGQLGFMTPYVWMFIGSYEKLRTKLIEETTITSLVQLEYSGFAGATVPICTFTLQKGRVPGYLGGYVRLSDFVGASNQAPKTLEAIANPTCGWFYRRSTDAFKSIPGTPIAYWASDAVRTAFEVSEPLSSIAEPRQGLATSDNGRFLRKWWEVDECATNRDAYSRQEALESGQRWFPIIRGGGVRKWWAITEEIVDWRDDGAEMKEAVLKKYPYLSTPDFVIKNQSSYFRPAVTWSKISSADISFRYAPAGMLFEVAGACMFGDDAQLKYLQALCNSSSMYEIACLLSPTLNFEVGQIATYPVLIDESKESAILDLVEEERSLSKSDWDSLETSWGFSRHALIQKWDA